MNFTWLPTFLFDHHGVQLKLPIFSITGTTWTLFFYCKDFPHSPIILKFEGISSDVSTVP